MATFSTIFKFTLIVISHILLSHGYNGLSTVFTNYTKKYFEHIAILPNLCSLHTHGHCAILVLRDIILKHFIFCKNEACGNCETHKRH